MLLRRATLDDAQLLFDWRNDPETRKQSRNNEKVSWEHHILWLTHSLSMSTRKLYLAEHEGALIGSIRSDTNKDGTVELSWTISPVYRGKGLGKTMVTQFVKQIHPSEKFIATIRKGNISSEKIAEALGLHQEGSAPSDFDSEGHSFMIWR